MRWLKALIFFSEDIKWMSKLLRQDPLWRMACNYNTDTVVSYVHAQKQSQVDHISPFQSLHNGFDWRNIRFGGRSVITNSLSDQLELYFSRLMMSRQFGKTSHQEASTRDWLAQFWIEEKKLKRNRLNKIKKVSQNSQKDVGYEKLSFFQSPLKTWFTGSPVAEERIDDSKRPLIEQPPLSQSSAGFLRPVTPEEMKVQPLLARANLLITRDIEWANLMLGFEQENRYAIVDACYPQSPAGFICEQSNMIFRQLLRSRRPFIAYITDAMGNELFRVRRPIWFINSTIYAEINGKEIGVVHRRWHLWRRVYDLYLGKKQFAVVENPGFWNWTFTLKDSEGNALAEIDRDWRGIGFELFTDAGQYVIRFGHADPSSKTGPGQAIQELEVSRPLTLSERAVAVALAVSLDNDYFSRHGGWGIPFIVAGE